MAENIPALHETQLPAVNDLPAGQAVGCGVGRSVGSDVGLGIGRGVGR